MDFAPDPHLEEFRTEVRALVADHLTPEMVERAHRTGTMHDWDFHRVLADTGFIAQGMAHGPGGEGRDPMELFVFFDEMGLAGVPFYGLANAMLVAGVLEQIGSEHHRREVLPRLHSGESIVALGYSEPEAGSDVAATATRADRADDGSGDWIVNGQKMFTTLMHESGFVMLLTRTNHDVPKHRGLTMFLAPTDLPGIEVQAVHTMGSDRTNITFLTDVRIADHWRLGEVDGGWDVMKVALAYERGVLGNTNQAVSLLARVAEWAAATTGPDGRPLLDDPSVRVRLARIAVDNELAGLLSLQAALIASRGGLPSVEGSLAKLFASEAYHRAAETCQDLAGPAGLLRTGEAGAAAAGAVDWAVRDSPVTTVYGGTSEIQRNNIAERHLGLPRSR